MKKMILLCAVLSFLLATACEESPAAAPTVPQPQASSVSSGLTMAQPVRYHAFVIDHCAQSGQVNLASGKTWLSEQRTAISAEIASLPGNAYFNVFAVGGDREFTAVFPDYVSATPGNVSAADSFLQQLTPMGLISPDDGYQSYLGAPGQDLIHLRLLVINDGGGAELIQQNCPYCGRPMESPGPVIPVPAPPNDGRDGPVYIPTEGGVFIYIIR